MKKIQGIDELKEALINFEQDINSSIAHELKRIGRTVKMDEFDFVPFSEGVNPYIEAIRLDNGQRLCETSFRDTDEVYLFRLINENDLDHWNMIALLGLLMDIPNGTATEKEDNG